MNYSDYVPMLNIFAGAGLGASFYILLRTQPYLENRSYDPKYNAAYFSRFVTGLIAGVILASALRPVLVQSGGTVATLGAGILAILGGYSAEAVELILQRLVEVILATIRGDGSAQVQAKASAAEREKLAKVDDGAANVLAADTLEQAKAEARKLRDSVRRDVKP
ncbi:hypothetical protein GCM10027277_39350 [Pseudoduganella ginsengisoli]|uniref:Holin n=1 Tax=Pseudoduganella ginsengisoli TaxID=1462440 RepID=A0A6L6PX18_9BURK|nr:hypothetical protein [Pseudoduganella ginsengisoli]MTW01995.1 hypothetical protein [Pseudoduganella ginsengisoli]